MPDSSIRSWQSMTTSEAERLGASDPVVILPVAAIEQHGPHLPLSTDLDIGLGLLENAFRHLPSDFPAWLLPAQAIGSSAEHLGFPGTLSLDESLLGDVIVAVGRAVARCGVRRLLISNSHGGNRQGRRCRGPQASPRIGSAGREESLCPLPSTGGRLIFLTRNGVTDCTVGRSRRR